MNRENQFVVDLLIRLRNEKFRPVAWLHFLQHSWDRSLHTARENPSLRHSWLRVTILIAVLAIAILVVSFAFERPGTVLRLLPGFLFCVAWQQSDLFWHLGLNRQIQTGKLLPTIGSANVCTWIRGLGASFLLGRLAGGVGTSIGLALLVFLIGIATDILDGQIARRTHTQSKLGQIGDGEADFSLYVAMTIILIQDNFLPLWLGLIMLLRFLVPFLAVLGSYFLLAHPVRFGSTLWGKYAALAQCLYFLLLLAPSTLGWLTSLVNLPLLLITLFLLVAAPTVQIVQSVRALRS